MSTGDDAVRGHGGQLDPYDVLPLQRGGSRRSWLMLARKAASAGPAVEYLSISLKSLSRGIA